MIQCSPPHICERRNLDNPPIHVPLYFFRFEHIIQRIVQGAQIGEYLLLEIARKKSQGLPRFNRRSSQDYPFDLLLSERVYTHCHREVGLASSSRTHSEYDIEGLNRLNVA